MRFEKLFVYGFLLLGSIAMANDLSAQPPPTIESFLFIRHIPDNLPGLRHALKNPDPEVRGFAAELLALRDDHDSTALIQSALAKELVPDVQRHFRSALEMLEEGRAKLTLDPIERHFQTGSTVPLHLTLHNGSARRLSVKRTIGSEIRDFQIAIRYVRGRRERRLSYNDALDTVTHQDRMAPFSSSIILYVEPGDRLNFDLLLPAIPEMATPGEYRIKLYRSVAKGNTLMEVVSNEVLLIVEARRLTKP